MARRLFKQRHHLQNDLAFESFELEFDANSRKSRTIAGSFSNGLILQFAETEVNPRLTLLKTDGRSSVQVCGFVDDVFPGGYFDIVWCDSTPNRVLLYGSNNSWVEFLLPSSSPSSSNDPFSPAVATLWEAKGKLLSHFYHEFSMCHECGLVVAVSTTFDQEGSQEFRFFEFGKDPTVVRHHVDSIQDTNFSPDVMEKACPPLLVRKVCLYSSCCCDHKLLVQYGHVVAQFRVAASEEHSCVYRVSNLLRIFSPDISDPVRPTCSENFALSCDTKLMGLIYVGETMQSCVWNLEDGSCVQVTLSHPSSILTAHYLSLGHLYQLLVVRQKDVLEVCAQLGGQLTRLVTYVISAGTVNGSHRLVEHGDSPRYPGMLFHAMMGASVHPCCGEESWMDSLACPVSGPLLYLFIDAIVLRGSPVQHGLLVSFKK